MSGTFELHETASRNRVGREGPAQEPQIAGPTPLGSGNMEAVLSGTPQETSFGEPSRMASQTLRG